VRFAIVKFDLIIFGMFW